MPLNSHTISPPHYASLILDKARALGFDQAALLPATPLPEHALHTWLLEGRHLPLAYMSDLPRHLPHLLHEQARSILVLTTSYHHPSPLLGHCRIARYAHHIDYHELLRERLERLVTYLREELHLTLEARSATDSAPLLERPLAARAALGWIGKNTLLIHPRRGSFSFIAELLLDLPAPPTPEPEPLPDRCGSCSRCLDACPTQALAAPYLLDARRCLSTWTIESSGPIPFELRPLMADLLFGCDICQEVCPWNAKAPHTSDPELLPPHDFPPLTPEQLLCLTSRQFNRLFSRSPLLRAGRNGLARNAAVVLGNRQDLATFPLLATRLAIEPSPLVRGHIAWAIARTAHPEAYTLLSHTLAHTLEPELRLELEHALSLLPL